MARHMQFAVVKQISLSLENHPGALHRAAAELARCGVNVHGISVVDCPERGVVRLHTSDAAKARLVLDAIGLKPTETDVFEFELPNQPGRLADVCRALTLGEVNIDYAYGSSGEPAQRVRVVLRASPFERAKRVLEGIADE